MAVDIKKMVDAICSLTVLELSKLVKALRDKFGLRTSDTIRTDLNEVKDVDAGEDFNEAEKADASEEGATKVVEEPSKSEKESRPVPDPSPIEVPDAGEDPADKIEDKSEDESEDKKESKPAPDPLSAEVPNASDEPEDKPNDEKKAETDEKETIVKPGFNPDLTDYDSNWTPTNPRSNNRLSPPPPTPKGEDYALVYAWRYSDNKKYAKISDNKKYAKIGESTKHLLHTRMPVTYYPTGDPVLIGIRKCKHKAHAIAVQNYILDGLGRTLPRREWVEIDEVFDEMIDKSFISDPDELKRIFGENIKTEKVV